MSNGFSITGTALQASAPYDFATGQPQSFFNTPDARGVPVQTNVASIFSDDFGGNALDLTRWDVLQGGLGANPSNLYTPTGNGVTLSQAAIGSGVTGCTYAVAASALTVTMPTTSGAELWLLSRQYFAANENITFTFQKSAALAGNTIFVGLVEVDPASGNPILNPSLAGDFTNRGGCDFGQTTSTTTVNAQAVADSSPVAASVATALSTAVTTLNEYEIEVASEDVIISQGTPDSAYGKNGLVARISSQCPNDKKVYKLLLRFHNTATLTSAVTATFGRILVECKQGMRVTVDSGNGDSTPQKAIAVNGIELPGVAVTGGGTRIMGSDGALARDILTDSAGRVYINGASAAPLYIAHTYGGSAQSTTPLANGSTFTGTAQTTGLSYSYLWAQAYSDQPGTLYIDCSINSGTNYYPVMNASLVANSAAMLKVPLTGNGLTYYRARYLNGANPQTVFFLTICQTAA